MVFHHILPVWVLRVALIPRTRSLPTEDVPSARESHSKSTGYKYVAFMMFSFINQTCQDLGHLNIQVALARRFHVSEYMRMASLPDNQGLN